MTNLDLQAKVPIRWMSVQPRRIGFWAGCLTSCVANLPDASCLELAFAWQAGSEQDRIAYRGRSLLECHFPVEFPKAGHNHLGWGENPR